MPTLVKLPKRRHTDTYRKDKKWSKLYGTTSWQQLRDYYLHQHPICENCLANDKVTPATEVHHKQFLSTDSNRETELLLDDSNLMSLCNRCHKLFHAYAKRNNLKYVDYIKLRDFTDFE